MAENSWHRYDMKKLRHCHPMYNIGFSPGYGGAITVRLANQTRYFKSIDLGPGNGVATPSLVQH